MTTKARASWNAQPVQLVEGDPVRVIAYGLGATKDDVGRTGIVTRVNKTRVVVEFNDDRFSYIKERAIDGDCLRVTR